MDTATSVRPRLVPSTRFLLAILLCFGFVVQYAQRTNLTMGIVCMVHKTRSNLELELKGNVTLDNKPIIERTSLLFEEKRFLWNELNQQIILGSYWGGYLLTLVPSGWLSITMGAKKMYGTAVFLSSLATIALSSIYYLEKTSFPIIVSLRIFIGAAHGALFPVTYTLWSRWAVPAERGTLSSISFCGTNVGTSLIVLSGGLFCRYMNSGWIYIFLLSGALGLMWLPVWIWCVSDSPEEHGSISNDEREYIQNIIGKNVQNKNRRPVSLSAVPWKKIVRSKPVIAVFFTELCHIFGFFFFLSNFGKLLTEIQHIPAQYTGYILACGFMCMLLGTLTSGIIADNLVKKKILTLTNARKIFNSLALFVSSLCMIAFCFCDENQKVLGVISVLLQLLTSGFAYGSGYVVNFSDIVPAYSGLIFGIVTTISSFSAVVASIIAGILIKHATLQEWRKLFILFSIVYFIGGVIYILLGSAEPEEWATFKSQEQQQHGVESHEETVPMQEEQQTNESKAIGYNKTG